MEHGKSELAPCGGVYPFRRGHAALASGLHTGGGVRAGHETAEQSYGRTKGAGVCDCQHARHGADAVGAGRAHAYAGHMQAGGHCACRTGQRQEIHVHFAVQAVCRRPDAAESAQHAGRSLFRFVDADTAQGGGTDGTGTGAGTGTAETGGGTAETRGAGTARA